MAGNEEDMDYLQVCINKNDYADQVFLLWILFQV